MAVGWIPDRRTADGTDTSGTAATPDAPEVARTGVGQSAMAAARLQLRRMVDERRDMVRSTPRRGRRPA
ncbi:MAG: hypothetical protein JWL78_744 [Chloroflexi bacterium]|jgi:hypothetical protein|nr:hypothetical protein [Chloroflexota bacterium]